MSELSGLISEYLRDTDTKTIVEFGAKDGKTDLNSIDYINTLFQVVLIEPHPKLFELCLQNRKEDNVKLINCAVSDKNGEAFLNEGIEGIFDGAHTLFPVEQTYKVTVKNKYIVSTKTLNTIFEENNIENIGVLVVDTEGYDLEVFKGLDLQKYTPRIIMTEWNSCSSLIGYKYLDYKNKTEEKNKILEKNGYTKIKRLGCNDVFVKN